MSIYNVPIILGASRPKSQSEKVAELVLDVVKSNEQIMTRLVKVSDYDLPYDDDKSVEPFDKIVKQADAFILVFPEYNHSFPGELKSLLDTELDEYKHKPVMLVTVSSGNFGGVRAAESITPVLTRLGMLVSNITVPFPKVKELFDEEGNLLDKEMIRRVESGLDKLVYLTRVVVEGKRVVK